MKAILISLDPFAPQHRIRLEALPATLGRSPQADVHLDDRWTSRFHCEISQVGGTLVVRDLQSKHGTFVNGEQVGEVHLLPGDRLTVGLSSFEVRYRRSARSVPAGADLAHR